MKNDEVKALELLLRAGYSQKFLCGLTEMSPTSFMAARRNGYGPKLARQLKEALPELLEEAKRRHDNTFEALMKIKHLRSENEH